MTDANMLREQQVARQIEIEHQNYYIRQEATLHTEHG
jgi:hypothetical protein